MHLMFLGKESQPNQSPTLFATDRDSYVVQGWIVTDSEILAMIAMPDDETIVEVPATLMAHLAKDGLSGQWPCLKTVSGMVASRVCAGRRLAGCLNARPLGSAAMW